MSLDFPTPAAVVDDALLYFRRPHRPRSGRRRNSDRTRCAASSVQVVSGGARAGMGRPHGAEPGMKK